MSIRRMAAMMMAQAFILSVENPRHEDDTQRAMKSAARDYNQPSKRDLEERERIAAKYRAERLERKRAAFEKRNKGKS